MSTVDRLRAFLGILDGAGLGVPIAWPGVEFVPPDNSPWIEARMFPNEPNDPFWDAPACVQAVGFFQVIVAVRPGNGVIDAYDLAQQVQNLFTKATPVADVIVSKTWQSPDVEEDNRISIPVTIRYTGMVDQA